MLSSLDLEQIYFYITAALLRLEIALVNLYLPWISYINLVVDKKSNQWIKD